MALLFVNIDHIATLRNQRGGVYPNILDAVDIIEKAGASGITSHLREDRRHIKDEDIFLLKKRIHTAFNMEMATTEEMLNIALKVIPDKVCLVPEKREELTTEGGLDLTKNTTYLKGFINKVNKKNIELSLFIEPEHRFIELAKELGASVVELHTGAYANTYNSSKDYSTELNRIASAISYANSLGLKVNLGHGLDYDNIIPVLKLSEADLVSEYNIGFSIISMSIFWGLELAVKRMLTLIRGA